MVHRCQLWSRTSMGYTQIHAHFDQKHRVQRNWMCLLSRKQTLFIRGYRLHGGALQLEAYLQSITT